MQIVVQLVSVFDAAQNADGLFDRWLVHHHRLETPFQRRVRFDVFAILVQRRRTDALQFAARERRFEDVRRVHRRSRRACAHQHVQFVDEDDGVAVFQLVDDPLQPLLELSPVHCAGDQCADVQLHQALAQNGAGHAAGDDALRQTLDDGGLADARFADQRRIVLGAAREDLDDALDFRVAPDDGIELGLLRQAGQIDRDVGKYRVLGAFSAP